MTQRPIARGQSSATTRQILEIRAQYDAGELDPRIWANLLMCSVETVRKIARRDTYRHVGSESEVIESGSASPPTDDLSTEDALASMERLRKALEAQPLGAKDADSMVEEMARRGK